MKMIDIVLVEQFMRDNAVEIEDSIILRAEMQVVHETEFEPLTDTITKTLTLGTESHAIPLMRVNRTPDGGTAISEAHKLCAPIDYDSIIHDEISSTDADSAVAFDHAAMALTVATVNYLQAAARFGWSQPTSIDAVRQRFEKSVNTVLEDKQIQWIDE